VETIMGDDRKIACSGDHWSDQDVAELLGAAFGWRDSFYGMGMRESAAWQKAFADFVGAVLVEGYAVPLSVARTQLQRRVQQSSPAATAFRKRVDQVWLQRQLKDDQDGA
jgi:hypothetical protein